jgi:endonuclease/exonuclease/phosphatase family metal-dependent hydrolase
VITRQTINDAHFGTTNSITIESMQNTKRYTLTDARVLIDLTSHPLMSSTNNENWVDSGLRDTISFFSFNANKNYLYTKTLLVHLSLQKKVDVIFLQEPPWRTIRHTPSAANLEGEEVIGPPLHHDWNVIYRKPDQSGNPRTMCYMHKRLVKFKPSYHREVIDHRDLLLLSLQVGGSEIFALNIYNDNRATAVSFLKKEGLVIPHLSIMTGNFNCHSMVWDPSYDSHGAAAAWLLELIQDLELDWDPPVNAGPTHIPHVEMLNHTVIDLIFTPPGVATELPQRRMVELQGLSDHIPLLGRIRIRPSKLEVTRITIPKESDEEDAFLGDLYRLVRSISALPIVSQAGVEERANAFASAFSTAWETNAVEVVIKSRSKGWWSKECSEAIKHYQESHNPWHYKQFQLVVRDAK